MNEIITPTATTAATIPSLATLSIQIPPLQVDMTKLVRTLFEKIRGLEERLQALEQTQQNRTPH